MALPASVFIGPGLIAPVGVYEVAELPPGQPVALSTRQGVIALDGEREIEFSPEDRIEVRLESNGPLTVDIDRVMRHAAEAGLLAV